MSLDFWIGVGVLAGIYGIFTLGLQLNAGFTGILNFGQAGFMAIGAYTMGLLVVDQAGRSGPRCPSACFSRSLPVSRRPTALRLREDYLAIATIAFAEIVRYTLQNAEFAGGNQGVLGFDGEWRSVAPDSLSDWAGSVSATRRQFPLLIVVWLVFVALSRAQALVSGRLGAGCCGRSARTNSPHPRSARTFSATSCSRWLRCRAGGLAGFFVAVNVTYLYPSVFDPTFTFFGYAILVLGGFASYLGVAVGAVLFWAVLEGTRFIDFSLSSAQQASLRFVIVGLFLIVVSRLRPRACSAIGAKCWRGDDRRSDPHGGWSGAVLRWAPGRGGRELYGRARSITALIGPNGAGKTTTFDLLSRTVRPDRGTVTFDGRSLGGLSPHAVARLGMVRTYQLTRVLAGLSVMENMLLAAPRQPGEHLLGLLARPGQARRRESEAREWPPSFSEFSICDPSPPTMRATFGRPAEAARTGPRADDRAVSRSPRRTDGRREPDPGPADLRPRRGAPARARHHLPLRRARHGGRDEPGRSRHRHGAGSRHLHRPAGRDPRGCAGHRRLSRRSRLGAGMTHRPLGNKPRRRLPAAGRYPERRLRRRCRRRDRDRGRPQRCRKVDAAEGHRRASPPRKDERSWLGPRSAARGRAAWRARALATCRSGRTSSRA